MSKFQNGASALPCNSLPTVPLYEGIDPLETKLFLCVPKLWYNLIFQKISNF